MEKPLNVEFIAESCIKDITKVLSSKSTLKSEAMPKPDYVFVRGSDKNEVASFSNLLRERVPVLVVSCFDALNPEGKSYSINLDYFKENPC